MDEPIVVQAICGFGVGSSTLLKIKLSGVFKELGVDANVINGDLPTGPSVPCDVIFCSSDIGEALEGRVKVPLVIIKNFANNKEIKEKVIEYLSTREN